MTTPEQIKKHMDELGWSTIELSRQTNIFHGTLQAILDGTKKPTNAQLLNIINKMLKHYPQEKHWGIYHNIMIAPILNEG